MLRRDVCTTPPGTLGLAGPMNKVLPGVGVEARGKTSGRIHCGTLKAALNCFPEVGIDGIGIWM